MMLVLQLRQGRQMCTGKMLVPVLACLSMKTSTWILDSPMRTLALKLQMLATTGPLRCAPGPHCEEQDSCVMLHCRHNMLGSIMAGQSVPCIHCRCLMCADTW